MRVYNSSTILHFTFCVSFLILFSVVNGEKTFGIQSCTLINGSLESVEVNCIKYYERFDDCFGPLFERRRSEEMRSKVKMLKVVDCGEYLHSFPKLFKNVLVLDISFHRNRNLSSEVLNYPNLEKLNASHSYEGLDSIDTVNIPKVIEIDLSHNNMTEISDSVSKLQHLKLLDLSFNSIEEFPPVKNMTLNVEHNDITEFDRVFFELVRNNVSLSLSWDKIKSIFNECGMSSYVPSLPVVDGENVIFRVTGTNKTIPFSRHQFQNIREFSFRKNNLENVPQLLDAMGSNIEYLDLSSNYVGKINSTTFQKFTTLVTLYLEDTNLSIIDPDAFKYLKKFEHLDLSNNNLKQIDLSILSNLPKKISIRNIQGENILEKIKSLPSSVKYLDVASNYIGILNAKPFDHLPNLEELFLRNTSLFQIETNAFQLFNKLISLDLSHNSLKQIIFSASTKEYSTQYLLLEENEFEFNLDSITPARFPFLQYLKLSTDKFTCNYLRSFQKRMKNVSIFNSYNETCYNLTGNIFSQNRIM